VGGEIAGASALHEAADGTFWVGTHGFGVFALKDGQKRPFPANELLARFVVSCLQDARDGGIWICSDGGGLWHSNGSVIDTRHGLASGHVGSLLEDPDGTLWVGSTGAGLSRRRDGKWRNYTTREGLCDDSVYRILEDGRGRLWMSSNRGVFRVDKKQFDALDRGERAALDCTLYDAADGLRTPEANGGYAPAGLRAHDGTLWFPTARGVVSVHPERSEALQNPSPPPVVIEELFANGEKYAGGAIQVPPGRGALELRYTALSLRAPERVRFQYRLDGFDRDWIDAGTRRTAYYTNLPPGHYNFRVKACNDSGVWNESGARASITLLPHFYQTRWFYGLCGLLVLGAAAMIYRIQLGRLRAQQHLLTRLVEVRTESLRRSNQELKQAQTQLIHSEKMSALGQLVAGVAHELNNPVNFISCNIDFLEERYRQLMQLVEFLESKLPPDAQKDVAARKKSIDFDFIQSDSPELVQAFRNGAERIARIVENLRLFSRGGELGHAPTDLAAGLRTTLRLLEPMLRDRVTVDLELDPDLPLVHCNGGQINQVFMNVLVNAVQAMGGRGKVTVKARRDGEDVIFQLTDTGPGVPPELRQRIFEPFFTTKEVGQGTGLGLSISFGIIVDHRGTIEVSGEPGEGATFTIRLPIEPPVA
jgi:signal transduction histidine kinase